MGLKVWQDGRLLPAEQARVSVYDHGFLYGDGVFEGIRTYKGKVFRLEQHLDRLFKSAAAIRLKMSYTAKQLGEAIHQTMQANGQTDAYIRLVVSRGPGDLGLDPNKSPKPMVLIITDKIALYPKQMYEQGMSIITAKTVRTPSQSLDPRIKSLNYLNNILAKIEALDAGVQEAVMLNYRGFVAEATGDNVFIIKDGRVLTPSLDCGILEGITRDFVMELAAQQGLEVQETELRIDDLYYADECFLTGTAAEIIPITKIDDQLIGAGRPGSITKRLTEVFHQRVNSQIR